MQKVLVCFNGLLLFGVDLLIIPYFLYQKINVIFISKDRIFYIKNLIFLYQSRF